MTNKFMFACKRCLKVTSTTNPKIADMALCGTCRLEQLTGQGSEKNLVTKRIPESMFGILKDRKIKYTQAEHEEITGD